VATTDLVGFFYPSEVSEITYLTLTSPSLTMLEIFSNTELLYRPVKATGGSAGFDIRAKLSEPCVVSPHTTRTIPTGVYAKASDSHYVQLCTKSGWAKKGHVVVGGVIDRDYEGEWFVCIHNNTDKAFEIHDKDFIAQAIVIKIDTAVVIIDPPSTQSSRGNLCLGQATETYLAPNHGFWHPSMDAYIPFTYPVTQD
jgi:deoxyuridine 5'-triphosphate nucleotidohydrolase